MGFYEHFSLIPLSSSNDGNARIGIIANSCEIHVVHIPCRLRLIKHCKLIHTWSFLELHLSNALLNISLINEKHSSSWCVRKITQILLRPYFSVHRLAGSRKYPFCAKPDSNIYPNICRKTVVGRRSWAWKCRACRVYATKWICWITAKRWVQSAWLTRWFMFMKSQQQSDDKYFFEKGECQLKPSDHVREARRISREMGKSLIHRQQNKLHRSWFRWR